MAHATVGVCTLYLELPELSSIKEKRRILKSLLARLHNTFNVSAAEIDLNDDLGTAVIAFAVVSNSASHSNAVLSKTLHWIEQNAHDVVVTDQDIEIL
ncbi:MAG: DUF503 domain-containing protein [bacterium]|nr:DUF503 domain-containing protein [bacterium]